MDIKEQTFALIDSLKSTCQAYGMGNDGNEYKIITQVFLYKFLNDKFAHEIKKINKKLAKAEKWEIAYKEMSEIERETTLLKLSPDLPRLNPDHLIANLWNKHREPNFDSIFDSTMVDIAKEKYNYEIFSTKTAETPILLFEELTGFVTDRTQRANFARALVNKLANFSFEGVFDQHYDFFAAIFEYLIKDYNTAGGGKYAEYYTPHSIATIMARLLVGNDKNLHNIECYDPSAGTGTLLMALSHRIGEDKCTIFAQDISQKSNKMLKLNLILNGLVTSLSHAIQGDTLVSPYHKSRDGKSVRQFDYVVSNPPFKMDFSETREKILESGRFWAGVPKVPKQKKAGMAIYTLFIQHIIISLKGNGKAAIVVPSGFLTDTDDIQIKIREYLLTNKCLRAVVQMPTNVFANTNTSVSVIFIDKSVSNNTVMFVDASKLGKSIKVEKNNTRTVFSKEDEAAIVNAIENKENIPEFSIEVPISTIRGDENTDDEKLNLIKPGLYFEMKYPILKDFKAEMEKENQKMRQRKDGLIRTMRRALAKNIMIKWFVEFELPGKSGEMYKTEYGMFPKEIDLVPLENLICKNFSGEWGKEEPDGKYREEVRCIRGTDIPNVEKAYYSEIPTRFVNKIHIDEKRIQANDIIIEISGGSPVQSTGRVCLLTNEILEDFQLPILCTNFCRVIRLENPKLSEFIYNYLLLLYERGYFFYLENNTTGIKNLIFSAFIKKVKVPMPRGVELIKAFTNELDRQCANINF